MHLSDGILPAGVALAGQVAALGAVSAAGRRLESREIPAMGIFAATLFAVSLLHLPIGGTTLHPGLYGLAGMILGRRVLPVIYVTLLFQSLIFQHGGLLALGVNSLVIGCGGLLGWLLWDYLNLPDKTRAFLCGFSAVVVPAFLVSWIFLMLDYGKGMLFLMTLYLPAAMVEGLLTVLISSYFYRVQPGLLKKR